MTICPFCKKAVVNPNGGPCPSCGKVGASAPPHGAGGSGVGGADDWDDMEIQHGSSGQTPSGPSSYAGGGIGGLGDDDDHGLSLELDAPPVRSNAPPQSNPSIPAAPGRTGASGQHPAYGAEPMPHPLPPRSLKPGSDPAMSQQQSEPNSFGPQSQPRIASQQPQQGPTSFAPHQAAPPLDAATMIAHYPVPPEKVWQTPVYAMRVLYRQFELRQDIESLRKRRSPDVPLYEQALKAHDKGKFAIGLAITCAAFTVATFIFFLPVILRFVRDPD